jgi:hypothetical protein
MSRYRDDDDDYDDDDDDEDDDVDVRRRSGRRRRDEYADADGLKPHRGPLILSFGLIGLIGGLFLFFPTILGVVAWIMGHNDLAEMKNGTMNREGESNTYAGYVTGIIATVIGIAWIAVAFLSLVVPVLGMFGMCAGCACCGAAA